MSRPGFNICLGPDPVLLKEHVDGLLAEFPPPGERAWERHVFWGDEPLGQPFWEKLTLQGLFDDPRALLLRNAQNLPAESLKKLSAALGVLSSSVWPFICFEIVPDKGRFKPAAHIAKLQCCLFAQKQGWYREIPPLDPRSAKNFADREAKRLGLLLEPKELEVVAAALPPDAGAIRLEMEKLALACPEGRLNADALQMLDYSRDIDIFAFLQALQCGKNPATVWRQFFKDSELASDSGLFPFIGMLLREARILWQLLAGEQVFLPPSVLQVKTALARSLGFGKMARIWDAALAADKGVKTGERSPSQAFERLLAELFSLFQAAA